MNKNLLFIYTTLIGFSSIAQELTPIYSDSARSGQSIKISSFNYYASNSFNNELTNKFIYGGNIGNELKFINEKKLGNLNSLGGEIEQSLTYINYDLNPFKNRENLGIIFSLQDVHFLSSNIHSDLYKTILYGNQNYLGDTMDFSFTHVQYQHYKKIGIGLIDKNQNSSLKLSYVNGNRSLNFRVEDTWLYSSPQSDSINFNLNGGGKMTDSVANYFQSKGHGFALDFEHNFSFTDKKDRKQAINFRLNNFGVIFWDTSSNYYTVDSANSYSGFELNQLINRDTNQTFSIDTLGISSSKRSFAEALPFEIAIQKLANRNSPQKLQMIFGLKAIITSDYRPYLFAGAYYAPIQNFSISGRVSYGGFGGFKAGLSANYWVKNKIEIGIGTFDLIGVISNQYGFGKSLNFNAQINF